MKSFPQLKTSNSIDNWDKRKRGGDDCPIRLSEGRPGPNTGLGRASTRRYSPSQPQAVHRMQIRSFQRARRRGHFPFRAFPAYSFLKASPQLHLYSGSLLLITKKYTDRWQRKFFCIPDETLIASVTFVTSALLSFCLIYDYLI